MPVRSNRILNTLDGSRKCLDGMFAQILKLGINPVAQMVAYPRVTQISPGAAVF